MIDSADLRTIFISQKNVQLWKKLTVLKPPFFEIIGMRKMKSNAQLLPLPVAISFHLSLATWDQPAVASLEHTSKQVHFFLKRKSLHSSWFLRYRHDFFAKSFPQLDILCFQLLDAFKKFLPFCNPILEIEQFHFYC